MLARLQSARLNRTQGDIDGGVEEAFTRSNEGGIVQFGEREAQPVVTGRRASVKDEGKGRTTLDRVDQRRP